MNVYFPTDDGSTTSKDALIFVLGELEALIGTQQRAHLLVAGDLILIFHPTPSAVGLPEIF